MWAGPRAGRSSSVACLTLFGPSHVWAGCGWEGVGWVVSPRVGFGFAFGFEFVCMYVWGCSNSPSTLLLLLLCCCAPVKLIAAKAGKLHVMLVAWLAPGLCLCLCLSATSIYVCMYACTLGAESISASACSGVACGLACFYGSNGYLICDKVREPHSGKRYPF